MKVAILLRGAISRKQGRFINTSDLCTGKNNYINFRACYNSIKKYILEPNSEKYIFNFFIHSWNPDLREELLELYNPVYSNFEYNTKYTEKINKIIKSGDTFSTISTAISIEKGIELIEDSGEIYDYVIIYRPDVILWKPMILDRYNVSDTVYLNSSAHSDFHFVMNYENMKKFKSLYEYLKIDAKMNACIYNFMAATFDKVSPDDIKEGVHQEVLRKLYEYSYLPRHITEQTISELGLYMDEIKSYKHDVCEYCKRGGNLSFCSHCKSVLYCSEKCLIIDWLKGHKDTCIRLEDTVAQLDSAPAF